MIPLGVIQPAHLPNQSMQGHLSKAELSSQSGDAFSAGSASLATWNHGSSQWHAMSIATVDEDAVVYIDVLVLVHHMAI